MSGGGESTSGESAMRAAYDVGKIHCGGDGCDVDVYAEDGCDCACDRCGPWNEHREGWVDPRDEELLRVGRREMSAAAPPPPAPRESSLAWEHEVVEEFGRPIRYSRVVEVGPLGPWVPYAPGDDNPHGAQARREFGPTGLAGPWMRSEAAAVLGFLRVHPDLAATIVVRAVR